MGDRPAQIVGEGSGEFFGQDRRGGQGKGGDLSAVCEASKSPRPRARCRRPMVEIAGGATRNARHQIMGSVSTRCGRPTGDMAGRGGCARQNWEGNSGRVARSAQGRTWPAAGKLLLNGGRSVQTHSKPDQPARRAEHSIDDSWRYQAHIVDRPTCWALNGRRSRLRGGRGRTGAASRWSPKRGGCAPGGRIARRRMKSPAHGLDPGADGRRYGHMAAGRRRSGDRGR